MFERKIGSYIRTFNKTSSNALLLTGVRQIEETLYKKVTMFASDFIIGRSTGAVCPLAAELPPR
jgi:hypothetical protein